MFVDLASACTGVTWLQSHYVLPSRLQSSPDTGGGSVLWIGFDVTWWERLIHAMLQRSRLQNTSPIIKSLTFYISTVPINSPFLNRWLGRLAQSLTVLPSVLGEHGAIILYLCFII